MDAVAALRDVYTKVLVNGLEYTQMPIDRNVFCKMWFREKQRST